MYLRMYVQQVDVANPVDALLASPPFWLQGCCNNPSLFQVVSSLGSVRPLCCGMRSRTYTCCFFSLLSIDVIAYLSLQRSFLGLISVYGCPNLHLG